MSTDKQDAAVAKANLASRESAAQRRRETNEEVEFFRSQGKKDDWIAEKLGIRLESLQRRNYRRKAKA